MSESGWRSEAEVCWEDGPLDDGCPTSCTLPRHHTGKHRWTRADQIQFCYWVEPEP